MQQHGVRMTCLEAKEREAHGERGGMASDLMQKLKGVRSMIQQAEENQRREEVNDDIRPEDGAELNPAGSEVTHNEVRTRVSMESAVQDPELGERSEEGHTGEANNTNEAAEIVVESDVISVTAEDAEELNLQVVQEPGREEVESVELGEEHEVLQPQTQPETVD